HPLGGVRLLSEPLAFGDRPWARRLRDLRRPDDGLAPDGDHLAHGDVNSRVAAALASARSRRTSSVRPFDAPRSVPAAIAARLPARSVRFPFRPRYRRPGHPGSAIRLAALDFRPRMWNRIACFV